MRVLRIFEEILKIPGNSGVVQAASGVFQRSLSRGVSGDVSEGFREFLEGLAEDFRKS